MFAGVIKWRDTFEGETSENSAYNVDSNAKALAQRLLSHLEANDELIYLEVRPEND